jgi:hypothetical protein
MHVAFCDGAVVEEPAIRASSATDFYCRVREMNDRRHAARQPAVCMDWVDELLARADRIQSNPGDGIAKRDRVPREQMDAVARCVACVFGR